MYSQYVEITSIVVSRAVCESAQSEKCDALFG